MVCLISIGCVTSYGKKTAVWQALASQILVVFFRNESITCLTLLIQIHQSHQFFSILIFNMAQRITFLMDLLLTVQGHVHALVLYCGALAPRYLSVCLGLHIPHGYADMTMHGYFVFGAFMSLLLLFPSTSMNGPNQLGLCRSIDVYCDLAHLELLEQLCFSFIFIYCISKVP